MSLKVRGRAAKYLPDTSGRVMDAGMTSALCGDRRRAPAFATDRRGGRVADHGRGANEAQREKCSGQLPGDMDRRKVALILDAKRLG